MVDDAAVPFDALRTADLVVDRVYKGGTAFKNVSDDPINRLLPVGNQGGFRFKGSVRQQNVKMVVLYTSGQEQDWPDTLDPETGDFTYFGDNRTAGSGLHDTRRGGNLLLRDMFEWTHLGPEARRRVPPIFLFEKCPPGRDVIFRGLLVPGSARLHADEELVAVWRTTKGKRFQNYRSHFTVLDVASVSREWIDQILAGDPVGSAAPQHWTRWVQGRIYAAMEAPRTIQVRSPAEQYPEREEQKAILRQVHDHFSPNPVEFEHFAAAMWLHSDPNVASVDVTRPSRDGGRDGIGIYQVGPASDPVKMEFALEAKCYQPFGGGLGVKMVSRLISRIKHREFGVFVTTAHIAKQAYEEVRGDGHPVIFITGGDIVAVLSKMGMRSRYAVQAYLDAEFPMAQAEASEAEPLAEPAEQPAAEHQGHTDLGTGPAVQVDVAHATNRQRT